MDTFNSNTYGMFAKFKYVLSQRHLVVYWFDIILNLLVYDKNKIFLKSTVILIKSEGSCDRLSSLISSHELSCWGTLLGAYQENHEEATMAKTHLDCKYPEFVRTVWGWFQVRRLFAGLNSSPEDLGSISCCHSKWQLFYGQGWKPAVAH